MAARKKSAAVATKAASSPVEVYDYGDDVGSGFENQTKDDYLVAMLSVLQPMSPQLEELDDAKSGMLINTVTNTLWNGKDGLAFIPAHTEHVFVEWVPRDAGGGFVAVHQLDSEVVAKAKEESDEFGRYSVGDNDLVETFYVFGVALTDDGDFQMVIPFTSTKIKKYKSWMTKAREIQVRQPDERRITPPLFAHRYRITTIKESNPKGDFWNFNISFDGENATACRLPMTSEEYQLARGCRDMVVSGVAKADYSSAPSGEAESGGGGDIGDDGLPF
jgi:hypothetical protein